MHSYTVRVLLHPRDFCRGCRSETLRISSQNNSSYRGVDGYYISYQHIKDEYYSFVEIVNEPSSSEKIRFVQILSFNFDDFSPSVILRIRGTLSQERLCFLNEMIIPCNIVNILN